MTHRGPTLGYRITEGDETLCYIPDHEPALGANLDELETEWISGYELAQNADLLIHDCQYTDLEYPDHVGWGHSAMSASLCFARRVNARRTLLFHHDPLHSDDQLDRMLIHAADMWEQMGGNPAALSMACERQEVAMPEKLSSST